MAARRISAAAISEMVAAWDDGIGSCPAHLPEAEPARLLDIPDEMFITRVIGFGCIDPTRATAPKSVARPHKALVELVRWEQWELGGDAETGTHLELFLDHQ